MFSAQHQAASERIVGLRQQRAGSLAALRPRVASDVVPLLWEEEFGKAGALDRAILGRSAALKSALYGGRVFAIVPIYVTSICSEQCVYCNYRAGNKGMGVERRRLSDPELQQEARYLVEQKGLRVLELVYATDPRMRVDAMCRHVELLRRLLDSRGGGLVAISAEALEESEYRRLVGAGLSISVLWQETYL
jgi:2-iminoacetate synthase